MEIQQLRQTEPSLVHTNAREMSSRSYVSVRAGGNGVRNASFAVAVPHEGGAVNIRIKSIHEVATDGKLLQEIPDISNESITWNSSEDVELHGVKAKRIGFSCVATVVPSELATTQKRDSIGQYPVAHISFDAYIFAADGDMSALGIRNFERGQVLWNLTVVKWPWVSDTDRLAVDVEVQTSGGKHPAVASKVVTHQDMLRMFPTTSFSSPHEDVILTGPAVLTCPTISPERIEVGGSTQAKSFAKQDCGVSPCGSYTKLTWELPRSSDGQVTVSSIVDVVSRLARHGSTATNQVEGSPEGDSMVFAIVIGVACAGIIAAAAMWYRGASTRWKRKTDDTSKTTTGKDR
jgi:hypothetical protein